MTRALSTIGITGLIVGVLDINAAFVHAATRGATPMRVLHFVASGLIGRKSFEGGWTTAALGLALHFTIALGASAVFYLASRKVRFLTERPVISGLLFGLCVWLVMNRVIVPLSAATPRHSLSSDLIQIGIHMFIIGLTTSFLVRRLAGVPQT